MKNFLEIFNQSSKRYYYYNGTRVYLEVDPEMLLISFKDSKEPNEKVALLKSIDKTLSIFSDLKVENLTTDRYLLVKWDRSAAMNLSSSIDLNQSEIENISQVFNGESNVKLGLTNQIFIQLKRRFKFTPLSKLYDEYDVLNSKPFGEDIFLLTLGLKGNFDTMEIANALYETGYFEFAEPNFFRSIKTLAYTPNDPQYPLEWHIPRIEANQSWCWKKGENISIGIMDVGINTAHPDLQANYVATYDPTGRPLGADGHGTPCAGCALAVGDNGIGVVGVAFKSLLYQIRVGYNPTNDPNNPTFLSTDAWVAGGLDYAYNNNIDIISASISLGNPASILDTKINTYTNNGRSGKGGVMLASTGNDGSNSIMGYPARHANVFAVGASGYDDTRASFSNYGGYVEFLAPGVNIQTTSHNGGYRDFSGTSAAAPVAAGAAALILSAVPSFTRIQLRDALDFNCDKTNVETGTKPTDRSMEYGYGRINVNNFFVSYYSIQGSNVFCGSQAQYNMGNLPSGITTSWNSSNPNLPISSTGLVTNPSGQAGRTILTANLSNPCVEPRKKNVVAGSYPEEVWAVSSTPLDFIARYWADGNNPNRKLGLLNNYPSGYPMVINFGYAPSVGKSTLNPPNTSTLYFDDQGWLDTNNGVASIQIISAPPTLIVYPITYPNSLLLYTSGDASGILEVRLELPCGPVNVKFYIEGLS
ncbi:S8 family peptidase [Sphingobacterium faecium]|uniref:S8 family peptidase n=1 Tax=Sphingobacterium faecium TaxID=34087 RepID=UPI003DA3CC24